MATFADDWIAFPHPLGILDQLALVLDARNIPAPSCFSSIVPGDAIAIDSLNDGCSGMAYGRVASVFPSRDFPNPDNTPQGVDSLAVVVEVGIIRGFDLPDNAEPVTPEESYDTTRLQMADMGAILTAICAYCDGRDLPVLIGQYTPFGPDGATVGGSWTATIGAL